MANTIKLGTDGNWAVKENNLLAYNDENNIFKPIDFDFTRDSGATRVNEQGLIENVPSGVPRIDFSDGKGSLLLEPQSTNLITHSEDFSDASWAKTGSSVVSGFTSPSGDLGAYKLVEDTSTTGHSIEKPSSIGLDNTHSFFVKQAELSWVALYDATRGKGKFFDVGNGIVGNNFIGAPDDAQIEALANGWYRLSISVSGGAGRPRLLLSQDGTETIYTGDGTSGVYIWGAQVEQGSYPTSYIPTSGATATRNAEASSKANISNLINSSEGVLYAEISALSESGGFRDIRLNDGTSNNRVAIRYSFTTNEIEVYVVSNGVETFKGEYISQSAVDFNKIAIKYKENNFSFFVNGIKLATSTSGSTPFGLNNINFSTPSFDFYGKVKDLRVYNTVLTDTQLQQLTS